MEQENKKHGLVGLILSCTVLPTLGITALPAVLVCLFGISHKQRRKRSLYGLMITGISLIILFWIFITFTPPGSIPYSLNHYKFKRACPKAVLWLNFKSETVADVRSQNLIALVCKGALHYRSGADEFQKQDVIDYAEANGWKLHLTLPIYKADFEKYEQQLLDKETDSIWQVMDYLCRSPIIFKEDCKVLVFDAGNIHGDPSFIFISKDGSQMIVYYENPFRPDPAMKFWLPYGFEELSQQRTKID
jgi:hypothetical protein